MPNHASLKKYVALRARLLSEQAGLQARLVKINSALGAAPAKSAPAARVSPQHGKQGHRRRNKLSLKAATLQVTRAKPLTKPEIVEEVETLGYKFTTRNPLNSLGVVLYSGKTFKNQDGKFSPAK